MTRALLLLVPPTAAVVLLARLFLGQQRRVFRPSGRTGRTPADSGIAYEEVRLACADGSTPRAWWVPAPGADRTVVYFHGSDGNLAHEVPVAGFARVLGVNALMVEYPGYGADGGRPSEHGCYRVADAGWDFVVRQRAVDPHRVILFGHSLGGAVAAYLAAREPCGGLVLHGGFTSVPDLAARMYPYLPVRPFCRTRLNSLERIGRCRAPVLVVHSAHDDHIPLDDALRLYRRARGPKRLVVLHGSHRGHSWRHQPAVVAAWRELIDRRTDSWDRE